METKDFLNMSPNELKEFVIEHKKYKDSAIFYGVLSVLLMFLCVGMFIFGAYKHSNGATKDNWKYKYDSLKVVYDKNAKNWEYFEKHSKGYYFINPKEKKFVNKFDLKKFTTE